MDSRRIEIVIDENGKVTCEAFNMHGEECAAQINKLMDGLATPDAVIPKEEYFTQKRESQVENYAKNYN